MKKYLWVQKSRNTKSATTTRRGWEGHSRTSRRKRVLPAQCPAVGRGQDGWANIWCAVLAVRWPVGSECPRLAWVRRCCCRSCCQQTLHYTVAAEFQGADGAFCASTSSPSGCRLSSSGARSVAGRCTGSWLAARFPRSMTLQLHGQHGRSGRPRVALDVLDDPRHCGCRLSHSMHACARRESRPSIPRQARPRAGARGRGAGGRARRTASRWGASSSQSS